MKINRRNFSYLAQKGRNGDKALIVSPGMMSASKIAPVLRTPHGRIPGGGLSLSVPPSS